MTSTYPTEYELHAYVDNELPPGRQAEVAAILREDAALAAQVAAYQSDRDLLRMAFGGIDSEPLPAAWIARIEAATAPKRSHTGRAVVARRYALAASIALVASVTAAITWQAGREHSILTEAQAARDGRLDGRIVAFDPLPPPATREAALRDALGMKVRPPELSRFGFQLVRMDLFALQDAKAAQLRYTDAAGRMLTIFVRPSDGTVQFDIIRRGDTHVCVWQDDIVGAVIVAPVSAAEMLRIASSAYTSLNL